MQLTLKIQSDHLDVIMGNPSSQGLRVWEFENSWGWFSTTVYLKDQLTEREKVIRRAEREWTRNFPSSFIIPAGGERLLRLNLLDGWWELGEEILQFKNKPVSVNVKYKVDPTPESSKFGVFVGEALSNWVPSIPPHRWLFATI
jgi:hypothetical protein